MTDLSKEEILRSIERRRIEAAESYGCDEITYEEMVGEYAWCDAHYARIEAIPADQFGAEASVEPSTPSAVFSALAAAWDDDDYLPWVATWGREDCDGAEIALEWAYRNGRISARELVARRAPIREAGNLLSS